MSRRGLRCVVEIDIHAVLSRGTWLQSQNDVYLSICLFGKIQKTTRTSSVFPLTFYEKLRFEKIFYCSYDPSHISEALEDMMVHINLMQIMFDGSDDRLLAWYNCSALQFLYPIPQYFPRFGVHDREVLMERSVLFPGISPKLEFSTRTVIEEVPNFIPDTSQKVSNFTKEHRRSRDPLAMKSCRCRIRASSVGHRRSALQKSADRDFNDNTVICALRKPPFVVRKVDDSLTGRQPCGDHLVMLNHKQKLRKSDSTDVSHCCSHLKDCVICQAFHRYLGRPYHHDIYTCPLSHLRCDFHSKTSSHLHSQDKNENAQSVHTRNISREAGVSQHQAVKHNCKVHEDFQCNDCQPKKPHHQMKSSSSCDSRIHRH